MTTYYLATDGSDSNAGTKSAPFGSLQMLLSALSAGDTGIVRGGTYYPTGFADGSDQQGTASAPITVRAASGESVVFDFGNSGSTGGLRLWKCAYWTLQDFTVQNAPTYGVYFFGNSSNCTAENVTVHNSGGDPNASGAGFHLYHTSNCTLRGCTSHDNYDPSSGGGNADGFAMEASPGTLVEHCTSFGNSDDGYDCWQSHSITIRHSVSHDNGWINGSAAGDGNGFKLGGGSSSGGQTVERCVAYGNRMRGFDYNTATDPITVYNSTAWDNPTNYFFAEAAHVLRNNISYQGTQSIASVVDDASNSWTLGISNPEFASTDASSDQFLHLTTGSPAVDAGVDVGLPYSGSAPDLGAYETDSTTKASSNVNAVLHAATTASDGSVAFTTGAVNYYDGSSWVTPTMNFYDGSKFLTLSSAPDSKLVEGFESGDIAGYLGDTGSFNVTTERAAQGTNSLKSAGGKSAWACVYETGGVAIPYGSTFTARVYLTDANDCAILRFGMADRDNWLGAGYNSNEGGIQISKKVNGSWTQIGNGKMTPAVGEWMTFQVSWGVNAADDITIECFDAAGNSLGTGSASASENQGNDGHGFEYTLQYGGSGSVYFDDLRLA